MKLGIIAVTYGDFFKDSFLESINEQTCKDFDLHIYHDGPDIGHIESDLLQWNHLFATNNYWHNTEERKNQYGHNLRDLGIQEQAGKYDYLLITNCDNYYCPKFVEYMLEATHSNPFPNPDVIYCDMIHSHNRGDSSSGSDYGFFNTNFVHSMCDIGAFIVKSSLAKVVGFKHRDHDADGEFIKELRMFPETFTEVKVNKVLFVHN